LPALLEQLLAVPEQALGLYNLVNSGFASAADQARFILRRAAYHGIPVRTTEVRDVTMASVSQSKAPRPRFSVLSGEKFTAATGKRPVSWQAGLDAHLEAVAPRYQV